MMVESGRPLSAVNTRKLLQSTSKMIACSNETHFWGFGTNSSRDSEAGHDFA
jgi:hypothetical protein